MQVDNTLGNCLRKLLSLCRYSAHLDENDLEDTSNNVATEDVVARLKKKIVASDGPSGSSPTLPR